MAAGTRCELFLHPIAELSRGKKTNEPKTNLVFFPSLTATTSSSTSQVDHATMSEGQLAQMLSKVKSSRETEELRARLPAQLAPFASNISITEPISRGDADGLDGVHFCACKVKERRIRMSVTMVPSPHSPSQGSEEPHVKPLELVWHDWWTTSKYGTGSADSHMRSISLQ